MRSLGCHGGFGVTETCNKSQDLPSSVLFQQVPAVLNNGPILTAPIAIFNLVIVYA